MRFLKDQRRPVKGGGEVGVSLVGCAVVLCALSRPVRSLSTIAGGACLLPSSPVMPSSIRLPGELGAGLLVGSMEGSSRDCAGIQSSGGAEHSFAPFL